MRYVLILVSLMVAACATTTITPPPRQAPGFEAVMYKAADTVPGASSVAGQPVLPIVKVQPQYPREALQKGLEGWVVLEFTVTESGTVRSVKVVDSSPPEIFDSAATDAARKFRFKPAYVDGKAVEIHGVQNMITFGLAL